MTESFDFSFEYVLDSHLGGSLGLSNRTKLKLWAKKSTQDQMLLLSGQVIVLNSTINNCVISTNDICSPVATVSGYLDLVWNIDRAVDSLTHHYLFKPHRVAQTLVFICRHLHQCTFAVPSMLPVTKRQRIENHCTTKKPEFPVSHEAGA